MEKTAHDFDQDLLILFDAYVHGVIDRRSFLDQAAKYAVGGVTAAMLLDQLSPKFAEAQVVPRDDARIAPEYVEYDSPKEIIARLKALEAELSERLGLDEVLLVHGVPLSVRDGDRDERHGLVLLTLEMRKQYLAEACQCAEQCDSRVV